jgi:hypothetical protein
MVWSVRLFLRAAAVAAVLVLAGCTADSPATVPPGAASDFGLPADASAAAEAAGLPMLGQENLTVHYHAHLDVVVRGQIETVPAFIGIDRAKNKIAPLHTHTPDGVVHIESASDVPFTLGQFFTEWGHPISAAGIGDTKVSGSEELRVYRNGQQVTGDPAALKLEPHDEIYVWIGASSEKPTAPASYHFANGL